MEISDILNNYQGVEKKINHVTDKFAAGCERLFYRGHLRKEIDAYLDRAYRAWEDDGYFFLNLLRS